MSLADPTGATILVATVDGPLRARFEPACRARGWSLRVAASGEEALHEATEGREPIDAALVDLRIAGAGALDILRRLIRPDPWLPVFVLVPSTDVTTVVECMRVGAHDVVLLPCGTDDLVDRLRRAVEHRAPIRRALRPPVEEHFAGLMGPSPSVSRLAQAVAQVAPTAMAVLLEGESGTGKEILARRLHALSSRRAGPFVAVDSGAIPETLLEGELFGFRRGSFTGASADREGKLQAACGGTLFLDEIGNLPAGMQAKLLRALQQREVTPLGASRPIPLDVRIVSATNTDLLAKVSRGEFRADLYHRIAEFPLRIPSLRERPDDVLYLTGRFLREACEEFGREIPRIAEETLEQILAGPWPGNARELRSLIRRAVLAHPAGPAPLRVFMPPPAPGWRASALAVDGLVLVHAEAVIRRDEIERGSVPFKQIRTRLAGAIDRGILQSVLSQLGGNIRRTARTLGVDYKTVYTKARGFGIGRRRSYGKQATSHTAAEANV